MKTIILGAALCALAFTGAAVATNVPDYVAKAVADPSRPQTDVARDVLRDRGFGQDFPHGLGHGVGFTAIDHNAYPRLHPASPDTLETGMVCNIEPAIYLRGRCGMRHCDMVHITEHGSELLTPFLGTHTALTAGMARRESLA